MRAAVLISILSLMPLLLVACSAPGSRSEAVLLPVQGDPTVSLAVWFDVGSQHDPPGKEGLAYLTGRLIAEGGTTERSYEQILDELYPMAASYDVRVDKEMTTITGRVHSDTLEEYVGLFTDAYVRPAFSKDDFERVRSDALNFLEKTLRYSSDEELGKAALFGFVFDGTPYRHPVQGTARGLRSITPGDVRAFYEQHFHRDSAVVAVGGGYPDDLAGRLTATLASLPALPESPAPVPAPPDVSIEGRHLLLVSKPRADASISFGFPVGVKRGDRDWYALWIANSWLGEHRNASSHLYQVIREDRGMNYGDYSYIEAFPNGGGRQFPPNNVARRQQLFEIWIRTLPNEWSHFALRAAMRELTRLVDEGLTQEQFELTRSFLKKYSLHYGDTTSRRLGFAIDDRFYGIDDGHLARFRKMMDELTVEEVNAAIKRHLQYDDLKIAIVTGDAEGLAEAIASEAPSPVTYPTPKPEAVLSEDEEISVNPLGIDAGSIRTISVEDLFES
ncbi:MAG: insulinase family protein [Acidobacteriota bacterium]|nr:insulinase family protein [Acidobacteriota bacterium]